MEDGVGGDPEAGMGAEAEAEAEAPVAGSGGAGEVEDGMRTGAEGEGGASEGVDKDVDAAGGGMVLGRVDRGPSSTGDDRACVVYFNREENYMHEGEAVTIGVRRSGWLGDEVEVLWSTEDGTSKNGVHYVSAQGAVHFKPGEDHVTFQVESVNNDNWMPQSFFFCTLELPAESSARLGLLRAKVFMLEDDRFPIGCPEGAGAFTLMYYFFHERLLRRGVKAWVTTAVYVYKPIYETVLSTLTVFFILETVRNWEKESDPSGDVLSNEGLHFIWYVCAAYFLCTLLWCQLDFVQLDQRGRSGTRQDLRVWVMEKFMGLASEELVSDEADPGSLINIMNVDVMETVNNGWYMYFKTVEAVVGLVSVVVLNFVLGGWVALLPTIILVPPTILCTLYFTDENIELVAKRQEAEDAWNEEVYTTLLLHPAIRTFRKVEMEGENFAEVYKDFYTKHRKHRNFELWLDWVARWVQNIGYFALLSFGPVLILHGSLSVASFVALVRTYSKTIKYVLLCNLVLRKVQRSKQTLSRISHVLNMPTEASERAINMEHWEMRRDAPGKLLTSETAPLGSPAGNRVAPSDGRTRLPSLGETPSKLPPLQQGDANDGGVRSNLEIRFRDVSYVLPECFSGKPDKLCVEHCNAVFPLGHTYAVTGELVASMPAYGQGRGKGIFCGLVAGMLTPTDGVCAPINVPTTIHSVVLHSGTTAQIFDRSVRDNLTYGMENPEELTPDVLRYVSDIVGMDFCSEEMLERRCGLGGMFFNVEDRVSMEIARSLLADPDVFILNGVGDTFSFRRRGRLLRGLCRWRADGGIPGTRKTKFTGPGAPNVKTLFLCPASDFELPAGADRVVVLGTGKDQLDISLLPVDTYKDSLESAMSDALNGFSDGIQWSTPTIMGTVNLDLFPADDEQWHTKDAAVTNALAEFRTRCQALAIGS